MVGSALVRRLQEVGGCTLLLPSRLQVDFCDQRKVAEYFTAERPDQVYVAAARVGGIHANNTYPAEFLYENLMIEANLIHSAFIAGVRRLVFLGSSCIYPREASQPMREEALLTGPLEPTNEPYAIAKIAGIKLCESYTRQYGTSHGVDYRSVMPTNLYGPGDNYHPENSHVIPALIRRFHEAKLKHQPSVVMWGTGLPRREFLHVDDLAKACVMVMDLDPLVWNQVTAPFRGHLNVGCGEDITIGELAQLISEVVGYEGEVVTDSSRPDGAPRKLMDSKRLRSLGWAPLVQMREGLASAYQDFLTGDVKVK